MCARRPCLPVLPSITSPVAAHGCTLSLTHCMPLMPPLRWQPASQPGRERGGWSVVGFSGFVRPPHPFMKIVIGKRCTGELWPTAPPGIPPTTPAMGVSPSFPSGTPRMSRHGWPQAFAFCTDKHFVVVQGVAPTLAAVRKPRSAWPVLTGCSPRI